jgi:hypothetical protein
MKRFPIKNKLPWLSIVALIYNPSYLGVTDRRIVIPGQTEEKVCKTLKNRGCWFIPSIPVTWEAEVRGLRSEAGRGKSLRLYLENKPKEKRLWVWLKW